MADHKAVFGSLLARHYTPVAKFSGAGPGPAGDAAAEERGNLGRRDY